MKRALLGGSILVFLTCAAGLAHARNVTREALRWTGKLTAGQSIRLRNVNGSLTIQAAAGDTAEVVATETKRDGDTGQVTVQVVTAKDGLVFCVFYPGKPGRCDPDGGYDAGGDNDDHGAGHNLSADLVVKLPRGVLVDALTVNGGVSVKGATAQVRAVTVNGGVEVDSTGGPVKVETVNGEVRARAGSGDVKAKTVNGSISVTVPAALDAEVRADVVHGSIDNDFGLHADGDWGPRSLRGKLGKGTFKLSFATVNGSISLKKP
jgi:hypothetical protein